MTLRLRHLRLRADTAEGPYGADFRFDRGLNVIWADNTKGKSTCMQAMLYALGLEKMLSPARAVPLPHAMTSYLLRDDESRLEVSNSYVELEIENCAGTVVTVHRPVKQPGVDNRLVTVFFGPLLSQPSERLGSQQFFVRDPGAFQREDGFLHFLEDFMGWDMPAVRKYEGPESKLPLETVFPLFWVEQKTGWSQIPAAIPTYFRVREVQKRAVEFIMNLDVHKLELERQRLLERIAENTKAWRLLIDEMDRLARRNGGQLSSLPKTPTIEVAQIDLWSLSIFDAEQWTPVHELRARLRARVVALSAADVPTVGATADALSEKLDALGRAADRANLERIEIHQLRQLKDADTASLERRVTLLKDDLVKNQDVQRLQRYSGSSGKLTPEHCPTCEQSLVDALLSQEVLEAVMPIDDNIEYIRSQLRMFSDILAREQDEQRRLEDLEAAAGRKIADLYAQIRTVRADLQGPSGAPSAAAIEERVRAEARIRDLDNLVVMINETAGRLYTLAAELRDLHDALGELPSDKMSQVDRAKLAALTNLLQRLARAFGFSTFSPDELTIDEDSYRPQMEGYEIGFETSASDAIRLKWAYQLGLLELSQEYDINHPGLLVLDEPRQQSSSKVSFGQLLERASRYRLGSQQVIVSTSEDFDTISPILNGLDCRKIIFSGYILQPLSNAN